MQKLEAGKILQYLPKFLIPWRYSPFPAEDSATNNCHADEEGRQKANFPKSFYMEISSTTPFVQHHHIHSSMWWGASATKGVNNILK